MINLHPFLHLRLEMPPTRKILREKTAITTKFIPWTLLAVIACLFLVGVIVPMAHGKETSKTNRPAGPVIGIGEASLPFFCRLFDF